MGSSYQANEYKTSISKTKNNYEEMEIETIERLVETLQNDLIWLRVKRASRQEWKSSEFRTVRRKIAQLLNLRSKKQAENAAISDIKESREKKSRQEATSTLLKLYRIKRTERASITSN